jgi:hypothetical protein
MAEYKTYTCDVCGKHGAIHLEIPSVDSMKDPADGRTIYINGAFDLCTDHIGRIISVTFDEVSTTIMQRQAIWKRLRQR